jgi:DNA-directed RNA polymerase specialized sigma24 family protein
LAKRKDLPVRHLRLIAKISYKYWQMLPMHIRLQLDLEDMVSDTVYAVARKSHLYKSRRAAETTFVQRLATHHCINVLVYYQQKKRLCNGIVELENWNASGPPVGVKWLEAKIGFERLLQFASDGLREALSQFIAERKLACINTEYVEELKQLTFRYHVNRDEFAAVLKVI